MEHKRILIVEDDPDISEVSKLILQDEGYDVNTCPSGSAVHKKLEFHPDLILLDINLPGLSGEKICQYLKSQIGLKQIPVILMSANMDIRQLADECGADGIVKKPFDLATLKNMVAEHLKKNNNHFKHAS
jgi:DNA-binding response OmpR family regulator